jgi:hypothetical protein
MVFLYDPKQRIKVTVAILFSGSLTTRFSMVLQRNKAFAANQTAQGEPYQTECINV